MFVLELRGIQSKKKKIKTITFSSDNENVYLDLLKKQNI